jgi:predicted NAD/FAD-binding protein
MWLKMLSAAGFQADGNDLALIRWLAHIEGHIEEAEDAIAAQQALAQIQGRQRTWFAGAWAGYGFHEDGLKAGMAVAQGLGAAVPWDISQPVAAHAPLPQLAGAAT